MARIASPCVDDDRDTVYATGRRRDTNEPVLVVLSPTRRGWRSRSTARDALNHDYVSSETLEDIMEWVATDLRDPRWLSRQETLEYLSAPRPKGGAWAACPAGHLAAGLEVAGPGGGERVLRHLERGC